MSKPHPGSTVPARPHQRFTPDGRRVREVLSYSRRGARLTDRQARAWERYADRWVIPEHAVEEPDFTWAQWFGRTAPLVVEIGSGIGEAAVAFAAEHPSYDVLALEVWRPGVAELLHRLGEADLTNVRALSLDATWVLEHVVAPGSLAEVWTFFPDPWPKTRHHKRRLVTPGFARLVSTRLAPDGVWRLATDWPDYAESIRAVLAGEASLAGGEVERWAGRPLTKFERRGLAEGRPIVDLAYRRPSC